VNVSEHVISGVRKAGFIYSSEHIITWNIPVYMHRICILGLRVNNVSLGSLGYVSELECAIGPMSSLMPDLNELDSAYSYTYRKLSDMTLFYSL
jgi:hypothetical protein